MNPINKKFHNLQNGSAVAWIMVVLLLIVGLPGWYLYYQSSNDLEKNKKQKQRVQQRYSQKSDELYESWNKLQKLQDENYQINNQATLCVDKTKQLDSQLQLQIEQQKQDSELLSTCTADKKEQDLLAQEKQLKIDELTKIQASQLSVIESGQQLLEQCKIDLSDQSEKFISCQNSVSVNSQTTDNEQLQLTECQNKLLVEQTSNQQPAINNDSSQQLLLEQCKADLALESQNFINFKKSASVNSETTEKANQQLLSCQSKLQFELNNSQDLQTKIKSNEEEMLSYKDQLDNAKTAKSELEQVKAQLETSNNLSKRHKINYENSMQLINNKQLVIDNLSNKIKQLKADQNNFYTQLNNADRLYQLCLKEQQTSLVTSKLLAKKSTLIANNTIKTQNQKIELLSSENLEITNKNTQLKTDINELIDNKQKLEAELKKLRFGNQYLEKELKRIDQENKKEVIAFNLLRDKLKQEIKSKTITIARQKDDSTQIKVGNDLIFGPGQIHISKQGTQILDKIAILLNHFPDRKVEIIGHTDDIPVRSGTHKQILSNWELSAARAGAAIRYLQHASKVPPQRMILVGASQYQPIEQGYSDAVRAKNRRIEIRLLPKTTLIKEIK
jgi:chemotaxis protein MotB